VDEDEDGATGVLVIRAWVEPGHHYGLRARITYSIGETAAGQTVTSAATVEDACGVVRAWLEEVIRQSPGRFDSRPI
jgi:hypothetical protein